MVAPRKYPVELQQRAVRLWRSEQPRRPIAHMARELGVHPEALRNWIRQDEADRGQRDDRLTSQQLEELQRLGDGGPVPLVVFDAGYDSAQLTLDLAEPR